MLQNEKLVVDEFLEKVAAASRKVSNKLPQSFWLTHPSVCFFSCLQACLDTGQQPNEEVVTELST